VGYVANQAEEKYAIVELKRKRVPTTNSPVDDMGSRCVSDGPEQSQIHVKIQVRILNEKFMLSENVSREQQRKQKKA
jgi:hypothetical protein